jgi:putative FmdB family regulatory protein
MPTYEYECAACGVFDELRPIAARDAPCGCRECGATSPRVLFTAPALAHLPAEKKKAHAVNERSSHAPRCGCALHQKSKKSGTKSFAFRRPWMISH